MKKKVVDSIRAELDDLEKESTARFQQSSAENFLGLSVKETSQMDEEFTTQKNGIDTEITKYTNKGIATGITLSTMALNMATINAELIAFFEDKYRAQTYNVMNGFQCSSMLELYCAVHISSRPDLLKRTQKRTTMAFLLSFQFVLT